MKTAHAQTFVATVSVCSAFGTEFLPVMQFQLGGRYYAEKPDGGPDWGLRFTVTFVLPK